MLPHIMARYNALQGLLTQQDLYLVHARLTELSMLATKDMYYAYTDAHVTYQDMNQR